MNSIPTPELLRKLLRHEPETGNLYWRKRPASLFSDGILTAKRSAAAWNARNANKRAMYANHNSGYKKGLIFGTTYLTHRVIWALHYGEWPENQIDHINHNRIDNRISNLRLATRTMNARNQSLLASNKSGYTGVFYNKQARKWRAQIVMHGKTKFLGSFVNKNDAIAARQAANVKYGFHENHGKEM